MTIPTLFSTAQAAAVLGVSPRRLRQLIAAGQVPARRYGRDWLVEPAALVGLPPRPRGWVKGRPRGPRQETAVGSSS